MSTIFQILFFLLNAMVALKAYNYRLVMEDEFSECTNAPDSQSYKHFFDISQFSMTRVDDTTVVINGHITSLRDFKGIWTLTTNSEHLENGVWTRGILQVTIPNVCIELTEESRPWHKMYTAFDPKQCPPKTGTTTYFDNQKVNLIINDTDMKIPIGNWRSTNYFVLLPLNTFKFCLQAEFEIFSID